MQTGWGMYHEEESFGSDVEGFQIWFEPYLQETVKRNPTYRQFEHKDFPMHHIEGNKIKTVIGEGSPLTLLADAKMYDISQESGKSYRYTISSGYSIGALVIRGEGSLIDGVTGNSNALEHKDFMEIEADTESEVVFQSKEEGMRIFIIQVPASVEYPLYQK